MSQHLSKPLDRLLTRRSLLRYGGSLSAAVAGMSTIGGLLRSTSAAASSAIRAPDSLPDPTRPAGTATESLPFEHIVVVMMENHSFDNLLGALALSGQPRADGLRFDASGRALNSNPGPDGAVLAFPFPSTAQGPHVSQTWNATHEQIDGGKMDGFVRSVDADQPMGYWTRRRAAFRLLAGTHVHGRQPLVLLGAVPDLSQPALSDGRDGIRRHRDRQRKPQRSAASQRHDLRPTARLRHQLAQLLHRPAPDGDYPVDRRAATRRTWPRSPSFASTARRARSQR